MGLEIDREHYEDAEYGRFSQRLRDSLDALRTVLARPGFGVGATSIGAELELNLIDEDGCPHPVNREVLASTVDPRITLEIDRFNLEINSRPVPLRGHPFSALGAELEDALKETRRAAATRDARVVTVGILPTLRPADLLPDAMTDRVRYRALSSGIRRGRQGAFRIAIEGEDRLALDADDVTLEGANTSFQLHLKVEPKAFARTYNAAQIATAAVLALSSNSPTFLGRRLWDETRIALFRQAVDDRGDASEDDWRPARVSFGHGWVRQGVEELFEEMVVMHAPLLPVLDAEDPLLRVRTGGVPKLAELRLHSGTVWRWNRPVYDDADGGHVRIELRALPAGPTVVDTMASAALLAGLTLGLAADADKLTYQLAFGQARRNFYQAAKHGLDAELLWPCDRGPSPRKTSIAELLPRLVDIAHRGLELAGVAGDEISQMLSIVRARVDCRMTGARWQRNALARLGGPSSAACKRMLASYCTLSQGVRPVHEWSDAK